MEKVNCDVCEYSEFAAGSDLGCCRRNPPVPIVVMQRGALGQQSAGIQPIFPPVFKTDWCGAGVLCKAVSYIVS